MALPTLAMQAIKNRPKIKVSPTASNILIASGLTIGVFFLVRSLVRGFKRNHRERHALKPGNPANYATQLKMAFENDNSFGWGTNEEAVFTTIEQIPSASMMRKVARAYRDLYGSHLSADLKSELTSEEFAIAQEIINLKS
ncbi:hypothetical protein [Aquimarina aquimarini]|uniref:hypothetical protein n=1 Tax=Aquimarina aquimarini TaxID=1191734 RepID=UPI000D54F89A|nr:hypothetical protein [Aquimarina aquimarini]